MNLHEGDQVGPGGAGGQRIQPLEDHGDHELVVRRGADLLAPVRIEQVGGIGLDEAGDQIAERLIDVA
ncbi:hypothetical protein ACRAWD_16850 [Caulobacter segnis]